MSLLILVVAANIIALPPLASDEVKRAQTLDRETFSSRDGLGVNQARIDALLEADRELLIALYHFHLQRERQQGRSERSLSSLFLALKLARLDDQWGLESFAMQFRERPRGAWDYKFKFIRNAKLIPLVGDLLFKNEVYEEHGDLGFLPTQGTTAEGIIETLKYAPQFRPDVSQWGQELDRAARKGSGGVLTILREWYRENEEKLRAGRFLEVRPGQTPQRTVGAESESVSADAQEAAPALLKPEPMSVAAVPLKESESYFIESVAVAALALLAGLLFFWKRRKIKGL